MIRTLLVEDEPLARDLLRSYLALHADVDLVGEAADGVEATRCIEDLSPDLVLLDIALPERTGVEALACAKRNPAVIFTTAYDGHAVTAFELGAFDYLLKPFTAERFARALERVRERLALAKSEPSITERCDPFRNEYLKRFFVRHLGKTIPVCIGDVVSFEADDDYTAVHANGRRMLVHVALREMECRLDPREFVRVHRSSIANLAHVRYAEHRDRRIVLHMSDARTVTSSRARTAALHDVLLNPSRSQGRWPEGISAGLRG